MGFGIRYATSSPYWQYYYFGKNIQGDVIALYRSDYNSSSQSYYPTLVATYSYDPWGTPTGIYDANGNAISQTAYHLAVYNPFRYRGYRYDGDTRLYYLQSRYYDPAIGRFINADKYAGTGQGYLGYNMFAYCNNSPIFSVDKNATSSSDVARAWSEGMWWITLLDGPAPVMDSIYVAGVIILFAVCVSQSEDDTNDPDITYPGDDPTQAPDGYEWTGPDEQGGQRGGYKNKDPNKKDSWHPDLNNDKEGPHWDYNDGKGHKWRAYPDGKIIPAKNRGMNTIFRLSARTHPKKRFKKSICVRNRRSMRF